MDSMSEIPTTGVPETKPDQKECEHNVVEWATDDLRACERGADELLIPAKCECGQDVQEVWTYKGHASDDRDGV